MAEARVNPLKILVTGGAGFIGSNYVRYMLRKYKDAHIVNLDLLTYSGRLENLHDVMESKQHKFVKGDIRDRECVNQVMSEGFDIVINFAAETHVDRSIVETDAFITTDVYGTYVLLEAARKHDVKRFVQVSTDEVYGSIQKGSFKEDDRLNPSSPYSASKTAAELMAFAFHKTYGLPVIVTRSSNNFGPYQHPEKLIPKMTVRALQNQPLPLYGDGKQVRDWLFVEDNCEALDIVTQKGAVGEAYNIASGEEHTNIEIVKLILKFLKKDESLITFVQDRPGHDRRYSISISKIRKLGWRAKHSFEAAMKDTVDWYVRNEWWWKPLLSDVFVKSDTPWTAKKG
ncbi:MAG: dTDP-glucose 4,6-dehydratase [Candidatus Bathyarchaeia archaeon]